MQMKTTGHFFEETVFMQDTWLEHAQVLQNLHGYLEDLTTTPRQKIELISALTQIAADQSGALFTLHDIQSISDTVLDSLDKKKNHLQNLSLSLSI